MNFKISVVPSLFLMLTSFSFAHAQVKQCPLDLSVTQYQKNAEAEAMPISDLEALARAARHRVEVGAFMASGFASSAMAVEREEEKVALMDDVLRARFNRLVGSSE